MWLTTNIQNCLSSMNRSRKIVLAVLIACALVLYLWPNWLHFGSTQIQISTLDSCLGFKLHKFDDGVQKFDVVINKKDDTITRTKFAPFVGNGYIGSGLDAKSKLLVRYTRALSVPINFYPIVTINLEGFPQKEATSMPMRTGIVHRIQCFEVQDGSCVTAVNQVYAHRTRPAVFVQELRVTNPTKTPVNIDIEQIGVSDWKDVKSILKSASGNHGGMVQYQLASGTVLVPEAPQGTGYVVAIASTKLQTTVSLKEGSTYKETVLTAVWYSNRTLDLSNQKSVKEEQIYLENLVQWELSRALNIDGKMLHEEHFTVWDFLWKSGFGISYSKAADAINGDRINATMYYVMSNLRAYNLEVDISSEDKQEIESRLYFPDRCYDGHHTLQNSKMWDTLDTVDNVINVVKTWVITLDKQGCSKMIQSGAEGIIQAMLLSFGALKFGHEHLEFGTHPKDLHRDYYFRRINYGNNTHLNISVIVGEDNKALLYGALDKNDRHYYACDAGCLDPPVKLSRELSRFPVKITDPLTSILYITSDRQHMEELKHAIHVREIGEAPAHEHHVIALHKHGHHYGGLPTLFWVSIGVLILIFHMFLFKLIFNEYCQGTNTYHRGGPHRI